MLGVRFSPSLPNANTVELRLLTKTWYDIVSSFCLLTEGWIIMWGAIIGDLAGSIYEYQQYQKCRILNVKQILPVNCFYSDDTILTIAVLDAILNDCDYEKYIRLYGNEYLNYKPNVDNYFKTSFSPDFTKWLDSNYSGKSIGNGSMMRISSVGYLFDNEDAVIKNARLATIPSHNSDEAIECATKIARIIYLARMRYTKEEIVGKLNLSLKYEPFMKFNSTCYDTIGNCLYATFTSKSFEESLYKILSYGGDTDTNACIVGAMAESLYGINEEYIEEAQRKIPVEFIKILQKGYNEMNK